jgi:hypothetical protein
MGEGIAIDAAGNIFIPRKRPFAACSIRKE